MTIHSIHSTSSSPVPCPRSKRKITSLLKHARLSTKPLAAQNLDDFFRQLIGLEYEGSLFKQNIKSFLMEYYDDTPQKYLKCFSHSPVGLDQLDSENCLFSISSTDFIDVLAIDHRSQDLESTPDVRFTDPDIFIKNEEIDLILNNFYR